MPAPRVSRAKSEKIIQISTCTVRVKPEDPDHIRTVVVSNKGRAFELVSLRDTPNIHKWKLLPELKRENIVE